MRLGTGGPDVSRLALGGNVFGWTADEASSFAILDAREGQRPPVALQPQYSVVEREPYESGYAPVAARAGLGLMPYLALAAGFLTGKYERGAEAGNIRGEMASTYFTDAGFAVVDVSG